MTTKKQAFAMLAIALSILGFVTFAAVTVVTAVTFAVPGVYADDPCQSPQPPPECRDCDHGTAC